MASATGSHPAVAVGTPNISALRFRIGTVADLPSCSDLLEPGCQPDAEVRKKLVSLWEGIVRNRAHTFTVIEDLSRPHPHNIEGFGMSVFVTDEFYESFCASPRPQLASMILERVLAGEDVLLTPAQQSRAHATTGLNLIALHFGMRVWDFSNPRTQQVLGLGSSAYFFFHNGLRISSILTEAFGEQSARYLEQGGFRLFQDYYQEGPPESVHGGIENRPCLYRMLRTWAQPGAVNPFSQMFFPPAPVIGFAPLERRILEGSLLNESDAEIAARLGVSIDTVKKTWRNIFARVSRKLPVLVPVSQFTSAGRGQEKRRGLIAYLRNHLEELRPSLGNALPLG